MTENVIYPKLADFLNKGYVKYISKHGRVSQNEYGAWLGLSSANISRYMSGKAAPEDDNLEKIAEKLGPGIYDAVDKPRKVPRKNKLANRLLEVMPDLTTDEISNLLDTVEALAERHKNNGNSDIPLMQVD